MTSRRLTDQPQPIRAPDDVVAVLRNGLAWAQQHPEQATRVQELTRDFERKSPSEQEEIAREVIAMLSSKAPA